MTKNIYSLLCGLVLLFSVVRSQEQSLTQADRIYNALVVLYKNNQLTAANIKKLQEKVQISDFDILLEKHKSILQKEWNEESDKIKKTLPTRIFIGCLLLMVAPTFFVLYAGWLIYSDYYKYYKFKEVKESEINLLNCIKEKIQHIELLQALAGQNN